MNDDEELIINLYYSVRPKAVFGEHNYNRSNDTLLFDSPLSQNQQENDSYIPNT